MLSIQVKRCYCYYIKWNLPLYNEINQKEVKVTSLAGKCSYAIVIALNLLNFPLSQLPTLNMA